MKKENEKRVFLTDVQYESLLNKFGVKSKQPERQITIYYNANDIDLRFLQTPEYSELRMKLGEIHKGCCDEFEVKIEPEYTFDAMEIFGRLFDVKTKWYRERIKIEKQPYIICIDKSINYYAIFEVEISDKKIGEEEGKKLIKAYLQELGLEETPPEIQKKKYSDYISNWSKMTFPKDEQWLSYNKDEC